MIKKIFFTRLFYFVGFTFFLLGNFSFVEARIIEIFVRPGTAITITHPSSVQVNSQTDTPQTTINIEASEASSSSAESGQEEIMPEGSTEPITLDLAKEDSGLASEITENINIGEEAVVVAEETAQKIEEKNPVLEFFFGPNYKELNNLNLQLEKVKETIIKTEEAKDKVKDSQNKVNLEKEIDYLNQKYDSLASKHDDGSKKFSLFGWAVKIFTK